MQLPLQITFRNVDSSDAVAARIRERAEELDRVFDRIMSCRVVIECRHPRHDQGNLFRIRVDLKVSGREIAVGRDHTMRMRTYTSRSATLSMPPAGCSKIMFASGAAR
jgi:ribosome-associated translation inhibitor RaiA